MAAAGCLPLGQAPVGAEDLLSSSCACFAARSPAALRPAEAVPNTVGSVGPGLPRGCLGFKPVSTSFDSASMGAQTTADSKQAQTAGA